MICSKKTIEIPLNYNFIKAKYIDRPNRFIIRAKLNNQIIESHLPDPGRLNELLYPNAILLLNKENNNKRKTSYSTQAVIFNNMIVSLNTLIPNYCVDYLIKNKNISFLNQWDFYKKEITIDNNRFDFQLQKNNKFLTLEVKSVTLVKNKIAKFPDAITIRGKKHMFHLGEMAKKGLNTMVLFVIQRPDAIAFSPEWTIDPNFSKELLNASNKGMNIKVIKIQMTMTKILYLGEVPFQIK